MHDRPRIRPLLVAVALAFAGSAALAQATDKERATTSKQNSTKPASAKQAPATKRLDFVPSGSVKETSTRPSTQTPAKEGWHCDHSGGADA